MFSKGILAAGLLALLAIGLPDSGAAAPARSGKLAHGKTSQGRGIGLRVDHRKVRLLDFNAELRCRDGSDLIVEEGGFLPIRTRGNGSFRDVQFGRTDRVWIRGRANAKVVRGKLRVTDRWGKVKCNSKWFRFSARIRG